MSNIEKNNAQDMDSGQVTSFQELLRLQSDIKGQGNRVAKAVNQILEALDNGGNVSLEDMNHLKAQILLAHLQLDELGHLLESFD